MILSCLHWGRVSAFCNMHHITWKHLGQYACKHMHIYVYMHTHVYVWIRMAFMGSSVWILDPQLNELLRNDWEVWPCKRRYVTLRFQKPTLFPGSHSERPPACGSGYKLSVNYVSTMPVCYHDPWHDSHGLNSRTVNLSKLSSMSGLGHGISS